MQLYSKELQAYSAGNGAEGGPVPELINFEALIGAARRQWIVVAVSVVLAIMFGIAYVVTAVPLFTSSASVLLDRSTSQVVDQLSSLGLGGVGDDESFSLSQVEILRSDTISLAVVDKLNLTHDPVFMADTSSPIASAIGFAKSVVNVSGWFVSAEAEKEDIERERQDAADKLQSNLTVTRVGKTSVLSLEYRSPSPELSARIANAFGEAFLVDKLNSKYEATRRASDWLQDRIAELRQKSLDTDLAVQKFRSANGLVSTGNQLVTDQQLSELNSALIVSQSDSAKAEARLKRIREIIDAGQTDAIVTDVLGSSISNDLRQRYLDASKREAQISDRLGSNHVQAIRLRAEMSEYKRLMFEEVNRIAESYKSDLDVAKAREKSLMDSVAMATGVSATANETQVQLRELERESETYKNLYQTFLQRYQEAVQQQSFPVTDARIITRAVSPRSPSHPKKTLVMALFAIFGAVVGGSIAAIREFQDRFFRTGDQIRDTLALEFLGSTPLVPFERVTARAVPISPMHLSRTSKVSNYVIEHPLSAFAETMRSTKIAVDLAFAGKQCKIIGIISALPGEGKSTTSINFAELLSNQGHRTILIDGDLRNPGATRSIGSNASAGLLEVLIDGRDPHSLLLRNPETKLAFLPAVITHRVPHSSELLSSAAMRNLLTTLSANADYIVIDLPPIGPVVDARAIVTRIDGFVFVTEWGRVARRVVRRLLEQNIEIREKCLGVILSKVDQNKMKLYRAHGSNEYYYSQYSKYYQDVA